MFVLLWIVVFGIVVAATNHGGRHSQWHPAHYEWLWYALPPLAGIAVVLAQWARHPNGVRDWLQGGVADLGRNDADRVEWSDWAIVITRRGRVDRVAGWVQLSRAVLFGLVPLGTVRRPLADFYRVEVQIDELKSARRRHGRPDGHTVHGLMYSVFLVDRRGDRLCVLDLATSAGPGPGERLVRELRERLQALVHRPGEDVRGPPRPL